MPVVELIYDSDCPNILDARKQLLRAFADSGIEPRWREWCSSDAESPAHVRGYGSPTILVDGRDVAATQGTDSTPPDAAPCCRLYAQSDGSIRGVPSSETIARALESSGGSGAEPVSKARWGLNLAMLPGIGAALLPKVACPACWPAYAGFLSSIGLGFLLETTYLFPLTAVFLTVAVAALAYGAKQRRGYRPLLLGVVAAAIVLVGKFGFESDPAMYAGLTFLIAASVWNGWPRKQVTTGCSSCVVSVAPATAPGGE